MELYHCPECDSTYTFPTPETAYERFCGDCDHSWQEGVPHPDDYGELDLRLSP